MICADCGLANETEGRCSQCGGQTRLHGRYRLFEVLGERSGGTTYRAHDEQAGFDVVVKELQLRATQSLKEIELFEREATLLARLDDPRVPHILDYFEITRGKSLSLCLVQQFIPGTSLEAKLGGQRFTEPRVAWTLADALEILAYIHALDPPVVHRDIKPANLLLTDDGELRLVDFGAARAVAETLHHAGSTVTGTFGYMAPEQLIGHAIPATDVFGLGATALRLLTAKEPGDLWGGGTGFDWPRHYAPSLAGVVDAMTAADPEDRPHDLPALAAQLRQFVDGQSQALSTYGAAVATAQTTTSVQRPSTAGTTTRLIKAGGEIVVQVLIALPVYLALLLSLGAPFFVTFPLVLLGLTIAAILIKKDIRPELSRWRLLRSGTCVSGLVEQRLNDGDQFELKVSYTADGRRHTSAAPVEVELALAMRAGDEVTVCFDPRDPDRIAVAMPIVRQLR